MASSRLRKLVALIATIPDEDLPSKLSLLQRSVLPLLSAASAVYSLLLPARSLLYRWGVFRRYRLPVPVISVGNISWGGNGKTPMVEFLARVFAEEAMASPLILTRGYAGGDEANMLHRHLCHTTAKIGIGANRVKNAIHFMEKYGHRDGSEIFSVHKPPFSDSQFKERIGVVILDDGMQHCQLSRCVDIVMVNGMMPWGNNLLLPRGPLREPLSALERADVIVIHNADLVPNGRLDELQSVIRKIKELPIFFTRLAPDCFFEVSNNCSKLPLSSIHKSVVLCVSGIGFPNAFVETINKLDPLVVEKIDFDDHHLIKINDVEMIKRHVRDLQHRFGEKPTIIVTEKDYDRDCSILENLASFVRILVLSSSLQFMPFHGQGEEKFREVIWMALYGKT